MRDRNDSIRPRARPVGSPPASVDGLVERSRMRPSILGMLPLITGLIGACGASGDPGSTTDPQTSTGQTSAATTTDPTGAGETHDSHASHTGDADSTSTGSESTTGGTTHGTHHEGGSATDTGGAPSVAAYCECMLVNCHDQYHGTWGEEHPASEEMCAAAAATLPSVGEPATAGNSLECRYHHCELGHDDPAACESAIGGGACV